MEQTFHGGLLNLLRLQFNHHTVLNGDLEVEVLPQVGDRN
jgi:hypothetical protein